MAPRYGRSKKRYRHEPQCGEFVLYAKFIFVTYTRSRIHGKDEFHLSLLDSVERSLASDWATHNVSAKVFGSREWHENGVPHYHVAIEFSQKIYWLMARKMLSVWIIVDGRREVDTQSIFIKKPKAGETNEKFLRNVQDYIAKEGDVFGQRIPDKERTGRRKRDCCKNEPQVSRPTTGLALAEEREREKIPESVGKYSKRIDKALPGKHTRTIYDALKGEEADVLVQLRTGMIRLNSYLRSIGATDSNLCDCGQATETVEHFLFRCKNWTAQREILLKCERTKIVNLSFFLGGKAASENDRWKPNMQAVRATIRFAMATKRLEPTGVT
ncbi:endonuclease/exonuclease/phosphatase [Purpureocillium lilacinum]|uniref:Endonuclease/exonuclease/phosphatase n=1 Tax=Purpureocillium lilacinum TaxID=33203 RepID=A0A179EZG0_PURLI|nr:endonuclease/exonuclease/phosphatase [Purpureocillium lilacinum]